MSSRLHYRRAVNWQNKNNRNFQCKFESKCEITIKNRKTCQACRFKVSTGSWCSGGRSTSLVLWRCAVYYAVAWLAGMRS